MIVMLPSKKSKKNHRTLSGKIWDLMEDEVEEDIKAGRVAGPFKSVKELMRDLRS